MTKGKKQNNRIREEERKRKGHGGTRQGKLSQQDTAGWQRKRKEVTGRGKCEDDKEKEKKRERGVMGKREEQLARS